MSAALYDTLRAITTATITTMLLKKGIRRCWMNGPQPLVPGGGRRVGPAFTLRFVPVREDLATPESWSKPVSTRGAIEAMPEGCIAVADAMGVASGVVGLVVDSVVFLWLAFGSLEFLLGQIVGKAWMVLLSIPFVTWLRRRDARLGIAPV